MSLMMMILNIPGVYIGNEYNPQMFGEKED